jgi:hypothetical protein
MYIDQTNIFRTIVSDKAGHNITAGNPAQSSSTVDSSQESSRAASPTGLRNRFGGKRDVLKRRRRKVSREVEEEENARRDFLAEAYRIVSCSFVAVRPWLTRFSTNNYQSSPLTSGSFVERISQRLHHHYRQDSGNNRYQIRRIWIRNKQGCGTWNSQSISVIGKRMRWM